MPTLTERETRLVDFLASILPGHRIVPTLSLNEAARRAEIPHVPEIRVQPSALRAEGVMAWKLEVAVGGAASSRARRVGEQGLLPTVVALRRALADPPGGTAYRPAGGELLAPVDGCDRWIELIEEPWTPAGRAPQALFMRVEESAFLGGSVYTAGTGDFGAVTVIGAPLVIGDHLLLTDAGGMQYLGAITRIEPTLQTEYGTLRESGPGATLSRLSGGFVFPEAGAETERHDPAQWRRVQFSLDGTRRARELGVPRFELDITFPIVATATACDAGVYLDIHGDRAVLLLVRSDRRLAEVSLPAREVVHAPGGGTSLTLRFVAREADSIDPFTEEMP